MVEAVARALAKSIEGETETAWPNLSPETQEWFRRQARAAIAAMREPTEAMALYANLVVNHDTADEYWRAMIDAALAGEGGR